MTKIRCLFALVFLGVMFESLVQAEPGALEQFTGKPTRAVWVQDFSTGQNDVLAGKQQLRLMVSDSREAKPERVLLGELKNYAKPMLTPDGQRVVYSDHQTQKMYVINFDGKGRRMLGTGFAIEVWRDPVTRTIYVYSAQRKGDPNVATYNRVKRFPLDEPSKTELIWEATPVGCDNFQLSRDGQKVGGEFPWPNGGFADLKAKTWRKMAEGCWGSLAPDDSGLMWVFDGPHRGLQMRRTDQEEGWTVSVQNAPGINGAEAFHPRWTNHPRYLVLTGPYRNQGPINVISGGGKEIEVHLGRFSPDFRSVEAWFQISKNSRADFYPDVWIDGGETVNVELPGLKQEPVTTPTWPAIRNGLVIAWKNRETPGILSPVGETPRDLPTPTPHGQAVFARDFSMWGAGGEFTWETAEWRTKTASPEATAMTWEFQLQCTKPPKTEAPLFRWELTDKAAWEFRVAADKLTWSFAAPQSGSKAQSVAGTIDKIDFTQPNHFVITFQTTGLQAWVNGKEVKVTGEAFPERGLRWPTKLFRSGGPGFMGQVSEVALYDRALSPEEIQQQTRIAETTRPKLPPAESADLQVRCLDSTDIPDPKALLPYRRALIVQQFRVEKVFGGKLTDKEILVAQWGILDGVALPEKIPKVGQVVRLRLEPFDSHPELKSERQIQGGDNFELGLWYDVNWGGVP